MDTKKTSQQQQRNAAPAQKTQPQRPATNPASKNQPQKKQGSSW